MGLIKERSCDFTGEGVCVFKRKNAFDRSPAPCGNCTVAQKFALELSAKIITERNRTRIGGRDNWQVVRRVADNFTFETSTIAPPNHQGPLLVRIQNGRRVV